MDIQKIDLLIQNLLNVILPTDLEIIKIIKNCRNIFFFEKNVLNLKGNFTIVGDIHGQYFDLLNIFDLYGPIENKKFVFLGDYVDRGSNSLETILLLFLLKIKYPENIFLLRGNHECELLTTIYGFKEECDLKTNLVVYLEICELFNYLPICAIVNEKFFCVHGGLIPDIKHIAEIDKFYRFKENILHEMFWSDPYDKNVFLKNPRGAGYLFGEKQVDEFCSLNNIDMIIRSHQLVMNGYKFCFDNKLVTIWSAPNYCYKTDNIASVMKIDENDNYEFFTFDKCERQK
ncbi:hypothetical protein GVAV_002978 [Gurleya vavrai]